MQCKHTSSEERKYRSRIPAFQCRSAHAHPTHGVDRGRETTVRGKRRWNVARAVCKRTESLPTTQQRRASTGSFQKGRGAIAPAEKERKTVAGTRWRRPVLSREIVGRVERPGISYREQQQNIHVGSPPRRRQSVQLEHTTII